MVITVDDLKKSRLRLTCHLDMGRSGYGKVYECVAHPRLVVSDQYDKTTRKGTRAFLVDNEVCLNMADAAFRLSHPPKFVVDDQPKLPPERNGIGAPS